MHTLMHFTCAAHQMICVVQCLCVAWHDHLSLCSTCMWSIHLTTQLIKPLAVQMMGFAWMFALFLACAVAYHPLTRPSGIHWFQFLYFFSSFWGQFGPNATTWLLPGELFPTETRAMSHGLSAAVGKVGLVCLHVIVML